MMPCLKTQKKIHFLTVDKMFQICEVEFFPMVYDVTLRNCNLSI